jgi:hypothetical protein
MLPINSFLFAWEKTIAKAVLFLSVLGYFLLEFHLTTHRKAADLLVASCLCSASAKELGHRCKHADFFEQIMGGPRPSFAPE